MNNNFPSPFQWWRLSLRRNFSSARRLGIVALVAGILVTVLVVPIVLVSKSISAQQSGETAQINVLRIDAPADQENSGLTAEIIDHFRDLPSVQSLVIDIKVTIASANEQAWSANLHVIRPWLLPPGITTKQLDKDQVILPDTLDGVDMTPYLHKKLPIFYVKGTGHSTGESAEGTVEVVGLYPSKWTGYGPNAVLVSQELAVNIYAARYALPPADVLTRTGVLGAWIQVKSTQDVDTVIAEVQSMGLNVVAQRDQAGALPGLLAAFPTLLIVISVCVLSLLALQISQSVKNNLKQRAKEFGLLRMRGYSTGDIRKLVTIEVTSGVALGATGGVALGAFIGFWITKKLVPAEILLDLDEGTGIFTILILLLLVVALTALALLIGLISSQRINRNDPFLLILKN